MLTQTLRSLECADWLREPATPSVPVRVDYGTHRAGRVALRIPQPTQGVGRAAHAGGGPRRARYNMCEMLNQVCSQPAGERAGPARVTAGLRCLKRNTRPRGGTGTQPCAGTRRDPPRRSGTRRSLATRTPPPNSSATVPPIGEQCPGGQKRRCGDPVGERERTIVAKLSARYARPPSGCAGGGPVRPATPGRERGDGEEPTQKRQRQPARRSGYGHVRRGCKSVEPGVYAGMNQRPVDQIREPAVSNYASTPATSESTPRHRYDAEKLTANRTALAAAGRNCGPSTPRTRWVTGAGRPATCPPTRCSCRTCSRIRRAKDCTSDTRWATSPPTCTPATSG